MFKIFLSIQRIICLHTVSRKAFAPADTKGEIDSGYIVSQSADANAKTGFIDKNVCMTNSQTLQNMILSSHEICWIRRYFQIIQYYLQMYDCS